MRALAKAGLWLMGLLCVGSWAALAGVNLWAGIVGAEAIPVADLAHLSGSLSALAFGTTIVGGVALAAYGELR